MNYTDFVADWKEYNINNDMVLLLIPEQIGSNLEKLNSYYERLTVVKRTECDYQLLTFVEKKYKGETIYAVFDRDGKVRTYDNDNDILIDINIDTLKRVEEIRIKNLTVLNKLTGTIMAYYLDRRSFDVVTDFIVDGNRINVFEMKK